PWFLPKGSYAFRLFWVLLLILLVISCANGLFALTDITEVICLIAIFAVFASLVSLPIEIVRLSLNSTWDKYNRTLYFSVLVILESVLKLCLSALGFLIRDEIVSGEDGQAQSS
ncbi:MAG: hypothetical protein EZS28_045828, partial [Streblomastix strix]